MDLKRVVIVGAALWAAIFFEVSILMFGFGLSGNLYFTIHYILLGILSGFAGIYYFMGKKAKAGLKEGLKAGIALLAAGIILDAAITVPLFVKDYSFFVRVPILLGYLEGVAVIAAVGHVKEKKG